MNPNLSYHRRDIDPGNVIVMLFAFLVLATLVTGGVTPAEAATVSLQFESETVDLDTGQVAEWGLERPTGSEEADVCIAYNADCIPHAVVFLAGEGTEIAVAQGLPFEMMTAQEAANLTFACSPPDVPFTAEDTVVIRTATGAVFKLGRASETEELVTFEYELLLVQ